MAEAFTLNQFRDDLVQIVRTVFRTMMDLDVEAAGTVWTHPPDMITSAVHFAGDWRGATLVECGAPLACRFAERFMGIPEPAAVDDDVRDVMGELANMVAGNLKSLLPKGVDLSMPTVVEGKDYSLRVCGQNLVERSAFQSPAGGFCVTLVELVTASGRTLVS